MKTHGINPADKAQGVIGYTERGLGNGATIGTFLNRKLRGKAKKYSAGYRKALKRACERQVQSGDAVKGQSVNGGIAYYWKETV